MRTATAWGLMAACALIAGLSACGTMRVEGRMQLEGPLTLTRGSYISDETFGRLVEGEDARWAVATFGEPDQKTVLADGSEVWRWTFHHAHTDASLLSFGKGEEGGEAKQPRVPNVQIVNTYVHVRAGMVLGKWRG